MNSAKHLWALAGEISAIIESWLSEHEGKTLYAHFKKVDLLRLTRLQVWSWKYKVSIDEILSLTLPYLRKSLSSTQQTRYGLGCSIASLTGLGNEKILVEAIRQKYPGAEHRDIWRQAERRKQLDLELEEDSDGLPVRHRVMPGMFDCDSVVGYLKSYRVHVLGVRQKLAAESSRASRKRKLYRGNPWL